MFPFLATVTFVIWLAYELKKHDRLNKKAYEEYWDKERQSNLVRKKPLDNLSYISIPMEYIPKSLMSEDPVVSECIKTLLRLSEKKIVNLTGYSNTELKMEYGAPNLNILMEYDENFTIYARTMNQLAHAYYDGGYESNARIILEKCIEDRSDIKASYTLLAQIYQSHNETEKIAGLITSADSLHSGTKDSIKRALAEYVHTD